jgi:hypothetical protein
VFLAQAMAGLQALPQKTRDLYTVALAAKDPEKASDLVETLAQQRRRFSILKIPHERSGVQKADGGYTKREH